MIEKLKWHSKKEILDIGIVAKVNEIIDYLNKQEDKK